MKNCLTRKDFPQHGFFNTVKQISMCFSPLDDEIYQDGHPYPYETITEFLFIEYTVKCFRLTRLSKRTGLDPESIRMRLHRICDDVLPRGGNNNPKGLGGRGSKTE